MERSTQDNADLSHAFDLADHKYFAQGEDEPFDEMLEPLEVKIPLKANSDTQVRIAT